jgi:hypothetical protein
MGSIEQFRQFLKVTLINSVNFRRDSCTDTDRFYVSFLSLKEATNPLSIEKFGKDVTNYLIDPMIFIKKHSIRTNTL